MTRLPSDMSIDEITLIYLATPCDFLDNNPALSSNIICAERSCPLYYSILLLEAMRTHSLLSSRVLFVCSLEDIEEIHGWLRNSIALKNGVPLLSRLTILVVSKEGNDGCLTHLSLLESYAGQTILFPEEGLQVLLQFLCPAPGAFDNAELR